MKNETRIAIVNTLAASATPIAITALVPEVCQAVDIAELRKDGLVQVGVNDDLANVVSLTAAGLATIPAGKSLSPAQHHVLHAVAESTTGQLPTTSLYATEAHKVTPAVLLEMVARGWLRAEYVEADGEAQAYLGISLPGKTGKDGTFTPSKLAEEALEYPVRAAAAKVAGSPRSGGNGTPVEHKPIPASFVKTFKDRAFTVNAAGDDKVVVEGLGDGKPVSLTAAAKSIQVAVNGKSTEVNGWGFFGLTK